jgi:ABC-type transport system substrate-binding protein
MAAILSVVAWSCTGDGETIPKEGITPSAATELADLRGGTLRVGACCLTADQIGRPDFLDPQAPFSVASAQRELLRCCLLRTLLSYAGRPTAEGGTILHPDLATGLPEVSEDGLTWTFHLKEGIRYAPPLEDVEITVRDIVRALERTATPDIATEEYVGVYESIEGVREFADGEASTISGLETPDPYTLRIHLTEITTDFGYRFALPATAPIPSSPADPSARFGAAEGHDGNYGHFLVSSGPYMIEGSQELDPSLPSEMQNAVSGLVKRESLTLVRNPSWTRETDELRKAYVDRIELRVVEPLEGGRAIERGTLDVIIDSAPSAEQLERFENDPELRDRVVREGCNTTSFASMRLAAPPFDDVHVRRAVNYAFDEEGAARLSFEIDWGSTGVVLLQPITHIAPESTQAGLLSGWDPYPFDLAKAREEMARSAYDTDQDGVCDHPSCKSVPTLETNLGFEPPFDRVWRRGLRTIGITLDIHRMSFGRATRLMSDPENGAMFTLVPFWEAEYPSPTSLFRLAFGVAGLGSPLTPNFSLVGANSDQLLAWGYPRATIPSVEAKIDECRGRVGPTQQQCWAELDQLLMLQVVPAIPMFGISEARIVSDRVTRYSVDQPFGGWPALDQIAIASD